MTGVSILICCYNAAARITPTLQHLQKQQFSEAINWEVIVVDNASADNTSEIAKKVWEKNPVTDFVLLHEEKLGVMNARFSGINRAKYSIISFVDDDNWVEEGWVSKVYKVFAADSQIGACGGKNEAVFNGSPPAWFHLFTNYFAVGKQADESSYVDESRGYLWGAGLSFRKSLWEELQKRGFKNFNTSRTGDRTGAGEDSELCFAFRLLGYHIYYHNDLTLQHYITERRMHFSYLEKILEGFGRSNVYLDCYRVLLSPRATRLNSWWYEVMVMGKNIIRETLISLLSPSQANRWKAKAQRAYWRGYAIEALKVKSRTQQIVDFLRKVFYPG